MNIVVLCTETVHTNFYFADQYEHCCVMYWNSEC